MTHLQHKVESTLQDRHAAHQLLQKRLHLVETRVTGLETVQGSLTKMQEDVSSVQDVQRELLSTVTEMGSNLDTLVNRDQPVSVVAEDRVADSVSSRAGARGLSPLLEKEEEDSHDDWVDEGEPIPGTMKKPTTVKTFASKIFEDSMVSEGHRTVSPPAVTGFGAQGKASTSGEEKRAGKGPLGRGRPDSPESGVSVEAAPAGLRVGQLKMDMPPVFTASRQQNVRGWLTKMERYFRLMRYPVDTWIEVVATRLTEAAEAWFNGESQRIETGARRDWRSWAQFRQEMTTAFEPMTETETARRQIIELRQTGRVSGYIQRFRTLRYKIPSMTEEEAHSLFLRGLDAGLQQQVGVHAQSLQEAMELAERADLYSKQAAKGGSSSGQKQKTAEKGNKKGWRGKGSGGAGPFKGSVSNIEDSTVSAAAGTQGKMGKGAARKDKGKRPQRGPMKCFVCGAPHRFFECPKWKSLLALADKKPAQGN